jgi:hypothetical protein
MPQDLSRLTAAVERDNTVNQSAITLVANTPAEAPPA